MSLKVDIRKNLGAFRLNVRFEAEEGVMGILGASGCGKSMTLRCIAGVERPDEGRIELDGETLFDSQRRINLKPQQRRVGYLFQNYALFPNMTVRQNILCGLNREKDRGRRDRLCAEHIELMQLQGLERRYPAQLSGGQQQRVALARILVSQPRLLMLDEPFSALDSHLREKLLVEMKELLRGYGGVSLAVTHSRDEAYDLCRTIALMENGSIHAHKPTKQLFADPGTVTGAMMTGCKNIAKAHRVDEFSVEVPDWGLRLRTARPVRENLCAVGVRAHYFSANSSQNSFPVRILDMVEEPFEDIIRFRYRSQADGTPDLWWRIPKQYRLQDRAKNGDFSLGVAPANVLLLYEPDREESAAL